MNVKPWWKPWWKSRTIWFNIAVTLVAIGNELMPLLALMDDALAAEVRTYLVLATTLGNVILRTITDTKVTR